MIDRLQKLKNLKGDHKIGIMIDSIPNDLSSIDENYFSLNSIWIADADSPEWNNGYIPDWTPDWLYTWLEELDPDYSEWMESNFEFNNLDSYIILLAFADEIRKS